MISQDSWKDGITGVRYVVSEGSFLANVPGSVVRCVSPRVDARDCKRFEMSDVACDDLQAVFHGGCSSHLGVVVVVNIMIGLIIPPCGLLLFIMTRIAEVPLRDIVRDVPPFLWVMIAVLALITFVPEVVLWLPRRLPGLRDP